MSLKEAVETIIFVIFLPAFLTIIFVGAGLEELYYKVYKKLVYNENWYWDERWGKGWIKRCS